MYPTNFISPAEVANHFLIRGVEVKIESQFFGYICSLPTGYTCIGTDLNRITFELEKFIMKSPKIRETLYLQFAN